MYPELCNIDMSQYTVSRVCIDSNDNTISTKYSGELTIKFRHWQHSGRVFDSTCSYVYINQLVHVWMKIRVLIGSPWSRDTVHNSDWKRHTAWGQWGLHEDKIYSPGQNIHISVNTYCSIQGPQLLSSIIIQYKHCVLRSYPDEWSNPRASSGNLFPAFGRPS